MLFFVTLGKLDDIITVKKIKHLKKSQLDVLISIALAINVDGSSLFLLEMCWKCTVKVQGYHRNWPRLHCWRLRSFPKKHYLQQFKFNAFLYNLRETRNVLMKLYWFELDGQMLWLSKETSYCRFNCATFHYNGIVVYLIEMHQKILRWTESPWY